MSSDNSSINELDGTKQSEKVTPTAHLRGDILKDAELVSAQGNVVTKEGVLISTTESENLKSSNPFADPEVKAYYIDLYEKSQYECRHIFDAELEWTKEEEKRLVRKLDWHGMYGDNSYGSSR
jgi:hypothetical protein